MGESQGAEDGLGVEGGEEPDEDEAGEQDEGGGEHRGFEQGLTKLVFRVSNTGSEERCGKCHKAVMQIFTMTFVKEAGDSAANEEMNNEEDDGVELEESNNKSRRCRSPQHMGCEE